MPGDEDFLSQEEATALWQRAAQLQAEAARRAEEARALGSDHDEGNRADRPGPPSDDGYALTHVRSAAMEAGIGEEFVDAALAEVQAHRIVPPGPRRWTGLLASRVLGKPRSEIVRSRTMRASPAQVLEAMEATLPFEPFTMVLRDRHGDPARGGVMAFDLQGVGFIEGQETGGFKKDASYADLRQLLVSLTVHRAGPSTETEMTVRAPIAWAWTVNAVLGSLFGALGGALGIGIGIGIATVEALGAGPAGILVALLGASGGTGGLSLMRKLYRYGTGRGETALDAVLAAVALKAEGGWGISSSHAAASLPPG